MRRLGTFNKNITQKLFLYPSGKGHHVLKCTVANLELKIYIYTVGLQMV